jgi:polysaccharide chain length determinant protein (PEP-CTERM system associated)
MLPGKVYKPEDILKVLRKRIWLIVVPWALLAAGTAIVARKLPDVYSSSALIQVVPQRVPGSIVQPMTTANLEERLRSLDQKIVTRTKLERLIQDLNLYANERRTMIMQDVVEKMRGDIQRTAVRGDAFSVGYNGRERTTVQRVAEELASFYIKEGLADGKTRAEDTSSFVGTAVEDARRELEAKEAKVLEYKLRHVGELPTERGSNQMAISTIQQQLQLVAQLISTDVAQKIALERQIQMLEDASESSLGTPPQAERSQISVWLDEQRNRESALKAQGKSATHPEMTQVRKRIKDLEDQLEAERGRSPVSSASPISVAEQNRRKQILVLKADLEGIKTSLAQRQAQEKALRGQASGYQTRVDRSPIREAELANLERDLDTHRRAYNELVSSQIKSDLAVDVQAAQIGEQFSLLESARLPERPTSPDRTLINIFGLLGGLAAGLGLAALLEYLDRSFKTDTELASVLSLPVLAVVPLMESETERRAAFRKRLILNAGLGSTVVVCAALVAYTFIR